MQPDVSRIALERLLMVLEHECALIRIALLVPSAEEAPEKPTKDLTWEQALEAMKEGKSVTRPGWKGRLHFGPHAPHFTHTHPKRGAAGIVVEGIDLAAKDWQVVAEERKA